MRKRTRFPPIRMTRSWITGLVPSPRTGEFIGKLSETLGDAALIGAHLALGPLLHRWRTRWGAPDEEVLLSLPGDHLALDPDRSYTRDPISFVMSRKMLRTIKWLAESNTGGPGSSRSRMKRLRVFVDGSRRLRFRDVDLRELHLSVGSALDTKKR